MSTTLTPKYKRESNYENLTSVDTYSLSHLDTQGVEPLAETQFELYQTCTGTSTIMDGNTVLTTMNRYDRCKFRYRGTPRAWEQIA